MNTETDNEPWEILADDWDNRNGDDGNKFHRELVRPATLRMLAPQKGERILDIACGNGVFTLYLAKHDVEVVAFDYSPSMIKHAKKRCAHYIDRIKFSIADATNFDQIISLAEEKYFDKAVANMAVMDISNIEPLFKAVYELLRIGSVFVFSIEHPCFQTPEMRFTEDGRGLITTNYIKPQRYSCQILSDNPKCAYHWHRSLQELLAVCFNIGFVLDGLEEPIFTKEESPQLVWENIPRPIVLRLRKI